MRYSSTRTRNAAQIIPFVCAAFFMVFSFLYLYLFQPELLAQEQYLFANGQTTYNPLLGACLITVLLTLLGGVLGKVFSFPVKFLSLAWFPSCYMLAFLTCLHFSDFGSDGQHTPVAWLIIITIIYIGALYLCKTYPDTSGETDDTKVYLSWNLILMSFFFFLVGCLGNAKSTLHYEMRMDALLEQGRYEEALQVGRKARSRSPELTAMRVYALCRQGELPDMFFTYPLTSGSQYMLPDLRDTTRVCEADVNIYRMLRAVPARPDRMSTRQFLHEVCQRDTMQSQLKHDLLLCAYLMDKDLEAFARTYIQFNDSLVDVPRYYKEALVLYMRKNNNTVLNYHDESTEVNLQDFLKLRNEGRNAEEQKYNCADMYGDSYWYYYYYQQ